MGVPLVAATDAPPVVISHVMAGESGAATSEVVALYNNSLQDIDLTGYCLKNKSAVQFACVTANPNVKVYIKAHNYLTIASSTYVSNHNYQPDTSYVATNQSSGSIVASSDTISLITASGQEIDSLMWTSGLSAGSAWQRNETAPGSGMLVDANSLSDFAANVHPTIPANASYDVETIIDVCPNIDGAQGGVPSGQVIDQSGNCVTPPPVDVCPNIEGIQQDVPEGYLVDDSNECQRDVCAAIAGLQITVPITHELIDGQCVERDVCPNITDIQLMLPSGYKLDEGQCVLDLLPLQLTEILPNITGSDTGNELIEIYNPTDRIADLGLYVLHVGLDNEKSYQFPAGSHIGPGEYVVFRDTQMKFNLVNTAGRVTLAGNDGAMVSQTDAYANPGDDESWALINGVWQYTDQPTPGRANMVSIHTDEEVTPPSSPTPCAEGKYRNPLTGRCRNIESDASVLASCDEGYYRNPETGRCRKITTTGSLAACKDGQYRSEETNRCRNISTASTELSPCKDGQERSLETNRCRNVTSSMPAAGFAVEPVKQDAKAFIGWWALGIVTLFALGYGVWEWRHEVLARMRKIGALIKIK